MPRLRQAARVVRPDDGSGELLDRFRSSLDLERIAAEAGVTPDRISFKSALTCIERALLTLSLDGAGRIPEHLRRLRADVTHFILPERRQRSYPRAVKIKVSDYPRKRRRPK